MRSDTCDAGESETIFAMPTHDDDMKYDEITYEQHNDYND